jgi:hypothetical protein
MREPSGLGHAMKADSITRAIGKGRVAVRGTTIVGTMIGTGETGIGTGIAIATNLGCFNTHARHSMVIGQETVG